MTSIVETEREKFERSEKKRIEQREQFFQKVKLLVDEGVQQTLK